MVMLQDTAEGALTFDLAKRRIGDQWRFASKRKRAIIFPLMRQVVVVEVHITLSYEIEVFTTEAEELVQALSFDRPHQRFSERVRVRCPHGRLDDVGALAENNRLNPTLNFVSRSLIRWLASILLSSSHIETLRACCFTQASSGW